VVECESEEALLAKLAAGTDGFALISKTCGEPKGIRFLDYLPEARPGLPAKAVKPGLFSVRAESYPWTRPVLLSVTRYRSAAAKRFRDFAAGTGQAVLREAGFVDYSSDIGQKPSAAEVEAIQMDIESTQSRRSPVFNLLKENCSREMTPYSLHFEYKSINLELYSGLNPAAIGILRRLGQQLMRTTLEGKDYALVLVGNTDNRGTPAGNLVFGYERAEAVGKELQALGFNVEAMRLPAPERTDGKVRRFKGTPPGNTAGQEDPLVPNDPRPNTDSPNNEKNRRVEIWLRSGESK
jgi:hypothetical protein